MSKKTLDIDLSFLSNTYEPIQLPSKGKPYDKSSPLSKGTVNIRSWVTSEEKLIDKLTTGNFYSIICKLVSSAVQERFDINELTDADLFFLLYNIRSMTYGSTYKIDTTCPECGEKTTVTVDIYNYPITFLDKYDDTFTVELPKTKIKLKMRYPKVKDLIESTETKHSDIFKMGIKINSDIYRYALCTEEMTLPNAEGNVLNEETMDNFLPFTLKNIWVKLPAGDITAIRKAIKKYEHGYLENADVQCTECQAYFPQAPLLGWSFFRSESGESGTDDKVSNDI